MARVKIGERFAEQTTLSREQISDFARMAGDLNPLHHNLEYARNTQFGELIASGTQTSALLMGLVPTHFAQYHATVGLEFSFRFKRAVKALVPLTLTWRVMAVNYKESLRGDLVMLEGNISDAAGNVLLESHGTILVAGGL